MPKVTSLTNQKKVTHLSVSFSKVPVPKIETHRHTLPPSNRSHACLSILDLKIFAESAATTSDGYSK